jgi:hypothetical protein
VSNEWDYVWGQCTYYAAKVAGWIPANLGNAKDWLSNAQSQGYATTQNPTVGSVAVFGAGNGYNPQFGHVAVVDSVNPAKQTFTVSEMNFRGSNVVDTRTTTTKGVLGFILPPGTPAGQPFGSGASSGNLADITGIPQAISGIFTGFKQTTSEILLAVLIGGLAIGVILVGIAIIGKSGSNETSAAAAGTAARSAA